jgi:phosphoglycerate kinase
MIDGIKTLDDFDVAGKTVLLRVDINSPVDSQTKRIKDDTRIKASVPTIRELAEKRAKVVIMAHQADPMDYQNFTSLEEHASLLQQALGKPIKFIDDVVGPAAREAIKSLGQGEILLLENVRIHTEETIIFEKQLKLTPAEQAKTIVVQKLAPLADIYLCDAFACVHRSEPTLVGFPEVLPSGCGRLFEAEVRVLNKVSKDPARPCLFMLGGAKILDAFKMMESVLANGTADKVLTTGLVADIMLKAAGYDLGKETDALIKDKHLEEFIPTAEKLLKAYSDRVYCPDDVAILRGGKRVEIDTSSLPADGLIVDIGSKTVEEYGRLILDAGTIFMNGPAGIYENEESAFGTKSLWEKVAESDAFSLIGGGDTIAAAKKFGVEGGISYICTAGGGLIMYLSGETLPVMEALRGD